MELFVHAGGTDALNEFAVLEFLVVLEVFDSSVDKLENGQPFRFLLWFFSLYLFWLYWSWKIIKIM